jgi:3-methyladenine DNA glycosylase AlkD
MEDDSILDTFAVSSSLWERRIAMLSTFYYIYRGDSSPTYRIARKLLGDKHDLIHKAVGWMLREAGKRVSLDELRTFLDQYAGVMPRTMLRYAIERMDKEERTRYLAIKKAYTPSSR